MTKKRDFRRVPSGWIVATRWTPDMCVHEDQDVKEGPDGVRLCNGCGADFDPQRPARERWRGGSELQGVKL